MTATDAAGLRARFALARKVIARSSEPLHVPLGVQFSPSTGERHLERWDAFARRVRAREIFPAATLYVHVPFCARVCTYCLLSSSRTPGKQEVEAYLTALRRQIAMLEPLVRGVTFSSLHIGGGTPTLLSEAQLDALLSELARFGRGEGFQIGIEAHPATATPAKLSVLARYGVDRVSFGVESFTREVLRRVNREDQTEERVRSAVAAARAAGLSVNVDMLAGLPGETMESFEESLRKALELQPDSMSVNRFLAESSALARMGYGPDEAEHRSSDRMLVAADAIIRAEAAPRWPERPLELPGFGTQYVWDRTNRARTYFQDDMIGPASTLALGHGSLGHVHAEVFAIAAGSHVDYTSALSAGRPPAMLESPIDERFEMAFYASDRACRGDLSRARFAAIFGRDVQSVFGDELAFLVRAGVLRVERDRIAKVPSRAFQVTHLFAFLLRHEEELARSLSLIEREPELGDHPAGARTSHASTHIDIVSTHEDDGETLSAAVSRARASGASHVAVWAPRDRPIDETLAARLLGASADELVVSLDGEREPAMATRLLSSAKALSIFVRARRGDDLTALFSRIAASGARRVVLDAGIGISADEAESLGAAATKLGLDVELAAPERAELADYDAVRAELPPSLLWCRIAMRAAKAARGSQTLATVTRR